MSDLFYFSTGADICRGEIVAGEPKENLLQQIRDGKVVILPRVFREEYLQTVVSEVFDAFEGVETQLLEYRWGAPDHWRIDNNPPKSSLKKIQSIYIAFFWNSGLPNAVNVGRMLGRFRNEIAGLPVEFGFHKQHDFIAMPVLQHYPVGGGFIGEHSDPVEPQKCVISLNLPGKFSSGGGYFMVKGEKISSEHITGTGDVILFPPDMSHGVDPIDPEMPCDFRSPEGRWRMTCVLTENEYRTA